MKSRYPLLAPLRHAGAVSQCPLFGVDQKSSAYGRNDAIDPTRTSVRLVVGLRKVGDEVSIRPVGRPSAYEYGAAVKRQSWAASLFNVGRRVRVRSSRNQNSDDTLQYCLSPLIAQEYPEAKDSPIRFGLRLAFF
jgi:hypothetical protein